MSTSVTFEVVIRFAPGNPNRWDESASAPTKVNADRAARGNRDAGLRRLATVCKEGQAWHRRGNSEPPRYGRGSDPEMVGRPRKNRILSQAHEPWTIARTAVVMTGIALLAFGFVGQGIAVFVIPALVFGWPAFGPARESSSPILEVVAMDLATTCCKAGQGAEPTWPPKRTSIGPWPPGPGTRCS
jgi:hypothetical protein